YNGPDSFTYKANDGQADSGIATVSITIIGVNDAPVAVNDSFTTAEDTTLDIVASGVLSNDSDVDGDTLSAVLVSGPANGSLTLNSDGSFSYVPAANYNGPDSFTYKASDGKADSGTATVTITVIPVNDAPVAADDSASTPEDIAVTIAPLANDSDVDGDSLTITSATATNGTVIIVGATNLLFTPAPDFNGTATISYTISDGNGGNASATVTVTVTPVNDAP